MTMTHKEALAVAFKVFVQHEDDPHISMEAAIRAYLDARGLVMVPRTLPEDGQLRGAVCDYTPWPAALWEDVVSAAPDPFEEGE